MAVNNDVFHGLNLASHYSIKISIHGGEIKMFHIVHIPTFANSK